MHVFNIFLSLLMASSLHGATPSNHLQDFANRLIESNVTESELKENLICYSLEGLQHLQLELNKISGNAQNKIDNKNAIKLWNMGLTIGSLYLLYKGITITKSSIDLYYKPIDLSFVNLLFPELLAGTISSINRAEAKVTFYFGCCLTIIAGLGLLTAKPFHSFNNEAQIIQKATIVQDMINQIVDERAFQ